jgi:hypothetical protein
LVFLLFVFAAAGRAQTAEVSLRLDEKFFDALLEAIFKGTNPPEFPLSFNRSDSSSSESLVSNLFGPSSSTACAETVKLRREVDGTATAVRFRDGRISAPIAFTGNYNPPLIGCVDFAGVAQTEIALEFDREKQALVGRAKVNEVNLSGTGGIGSGLLARMVQSSIDRKINPINILQMERVSFTVPIQNSGSLNMKAIGIRHEVAAGALNVFVTYEFR